MEFLTLVFLFVLFMALAVLSDASVRNQQRKREQIAKQRLTPPTSLTATVPPTPAPAAKAAAYTNQLYLRRRIERMIARAGLQLSPATLVGGMFALLVLGMSIAALWFELIISALCG